MRKGSKKHRLTFDIPGIYSVGGGLSFEQESRLKEQDRGYALEDRKYSNQQKGISAGFDIAGSVLSPTQHQGVQNTGNSQLDYYNAQMQHDQERNSKIGGTTLGLVAAGAAVGLGAPQFAGQAFGAGNKVGSGIGGLFAEGGKLTYYNAGGTHEQNPYGGIPIGENNSVEEKEYRYDSGEKGDGGKILSNRLPELGPSYAKRMKKWENKLKLRPNDTLSKELIAQKFDKLYEQQEAFKKQAQVQAQEQTMYAAYGGKLGFGGVGELDNPTLPALPNTALPPADSLKATVNKFAAPDSNGGMNLNPTMFNVAGTTQTVNPDGTISRTIPAIKSINQVNKPQFTGVQNTATPPTSTYSQEGDKFYQTIVGGQGTKKFSISEPLFNQRTGKSNLKKPSTFDINTGHALGGEISGGGYFNPTLAPAFLQNTVQNFNQQEAKLTPQQKAELEKQRKLEYLKAHPEKYNVGYYQQYKKSEPGLEESVSPLDFLGPAEIKAVGKLASKAVGKLAGAGEKVLPKITNTINQAYKVNPNRFKPKVTSAHRMIGDEEGLASALESKYLKPSTTGSDIGKIHTNTHYTIGAPSDGREYFDRTWNREFPGPYMVEIPNATTDIRFAQGPGGKEMGADVFTYPENYIPTSEANFYKKHWWKGYKPVDVPKKQKGGGNSTIAGLEAEQKRLNMQKQEKKALGGDLKSPYSVKDSTTIVNKADKDKNIYELKVGKKGDKLYQNGKEINFGGMNALTRDAIRLKLDRQKIASGIDPNDPTLYNIFKPRDNSIVEQAYGGQLVEGGTLSYTAPTVDVEAIKKKYGYNPSKEGKLWEETRKKIKFNPQDVNLETDESVFTDLQGLVPNTEQTGNIGAPKVPSTYNPSAAEQQFFANYKDPALAPSNNTTDKKSNVPQNKYSPLGMIAQAASPLYQGALGLLNKDTVNFEAPTLQGINPYYQARLQEAQINEQLNASRNAFRNNANTQGAYLAGMTNLGAIGADTAGQQIGQIYGQANQYNNSINNQNIAARVANANLNQDTRQREKDASRTAFNMALQGAGQGIATGVKDKYAAESNNLYNTEMSKVLADLYKDYHWEGDKKTGNWVYNTPPTPPATPAPTITTPTITAPPIVPSKYNGKKYGGSIYKRGGKLMNYC